MIEIRNITEAFSHSIPLWARKFLQLYTKSKGNSFESDVTVDYKSIPWDKIAWYDVADLDNLPSDLFNVNSDKYYIIDTYHKEAPDIRIIFAPQFGCYWSEKTGLEGSVFNGEVGEGDSYTDDMLQLIFNSVNITDAGYILKDELGE